MDRHIQIFRNMLSFVSIAIATITILIPFLQTPETCVSPSTPPKLHHKFPKSSCDSSPRELLLIQKKNRRLWSTRDWEKKISWFTHLFISIQDRKALNNNTKVLCVLAGAGHEVMALLNLGVKDVTGVELVDSPPLVRRVDPHNLQFFYEVFDLAFSAHFNETLFPARFVKEMERMVRPVRVCMLTVEECSDEKAREIAGLFEKSRFVGVMNVTLIGLKMTQDYNENKNSSLKS